MIRPATAQPSRRTVGFTAGLSAVAILSLAGVGGCKFDLGQGDVATTSVVLVDHSASIAEPDRQIYIQSLQALAAGLGNGDRLLIARVGSAGRSQFVPIIDVSYHKVGARLDDEAQLVMKQRQLAEALPNLLPARDGPGEANTRLIETIAAAAEVFGRSGTSATPGAREIVLLSDGVEDSTLIDLDFPATEERAGDALDKARGLGLLPDLRGVELSVIGAGGKDYASTELFWRAYASATGARLVRYGRLPIEPGR